MANTNLLAIITVMILVGSSGSAQQEPNLEDLLTIEKLMDGGDWRALYFYIQANPRLTAGQGPLALELRSFVDDAKRGSLVTFDASSDPSGQRNASSQNGTDASIY